MSIEERQWQPPSGGPSLPALVLQHQGIRVVVIPERGGKIVSLFDVQRDKEWLWLNSQLSWRPPSPNDSYVKTHDLGGWDECFPTVAPTTVAGRSWPDHGDLWWRAWRHQVQGNTLWMGVEGDDYRFERTIQPAQQGFRLSYTVTNLSQRTFPYLWCAHPLFQLDSPLTLSVQGRPELRGGFEETSRWPIFQERNLEQVGKLSEWAVKLFLAMETGEITLSDRAGASVRMRWPLERVPLLGLWINEGGWSGTGGPPYRNLGVEPASGAPDDLAVALNEWQCAQTLAVGEAHSWWIELQFAVEE